MLNGRKPTLPVAVVDLTVLPILAENQRHKVTRSAVPSPGLNQYRIALLVWDELNSLPIPNIAERQIEKVDVKKLRHWDILPAPIQLNITDGFHDRMLLTLFK